MTDLPEALPILRHNTEATFAALAGGRGSANHDVSQRRIEAEACRRPSIRQLCWGDAAEAGEVAAAAAAAVEREGSTWQGFDLVVVRGRRGGKFPKCHSTSCSALCGMHDTTRNVRTSMCKYVRAGHQNNQHVARTENYD